MQELIRRTVRNPTQPRSIYRPPAGVTGTNRGIPISLSARSVSQILQSRGCLSAPLRSCKFALTEANPRHPLGLRNLRMSQVIIRIIDPTIHSEASDVSIGENVAHHVQFVRRVSAAFSAADKTTDCTWFPNTKIRGKGSAVNLASSSATIRGFNHRVADRPDRCFDLSRRLIAYFSIVSYESQSLCPVIHPLPDRLKHAARMFP